MYLYRLRQLIPFPASTARTSPICRSVSGSCQTSESPLPRRGGVYPPASKESAQLSRRFSPAGFFVCGTGASLKKALVGASTQCTAKPAQTGGLTPPLPTLEKTELLCTAGKIVFHRGHFPPNGNLSNIENRSFSIMHLASAGQKNPVFHSAPAPFGQKSHLHITHPASVKRRNPLYLVGAGSTRPLLRNLHNYPGGFPPPDFVFLLRGKSDNRMRSSVPLPDAPHPPAQTGGLTPPLPTLEKTELLCTAGKFVLHCGYFSFSYRLPPGEKILFVITHPASVKRRNPLSLVGAGSTRPLLRNLHNHPGGFPPPDFLFVVLVPLS